MSSRSSTRAEAGSLVRLALPLAGANLAGLGMVVTDMAIVGRIGAVELAAVGLAGGVLLDAVAILTGVLTVVGVLVAEGYGAGDRDRIAEITWQGFTIATLLAFPLTALALNLSALLALTGQDAAVLALGDTYLRALAWSLLPAMLFAVLVDTVTALHHAKAVFVVSTGAVVVNGVASYALVFGALGMPGLGVAGAGYATSAVNALMLLALVVWCRRAPEIRAHLSLFPPAKLRLQEFSSIVRLGAPVVGITVAESGFYSILNILIGAFGAIALAASRIVFGYVKVALAFAFALADAATIRVALGIGRGRPGDSRLAGHLALYVGAGVLSLLALPAIFAPELITALFLGGFDETDAATAEVARALFTAGAIYLIINGMQTIAEHALRGLKDTLVPMWQSAFGLWVAGLGAALLLAYPAALGPLGLWLGLIVGSLVTAVLFTVRFNRLTRDMGAVSDEGK
jgi:multidrug resistance protein, MATE family